MFLCCSKGCLFVVCLRVFVLSCCVCCVSWSWVLLICAFALFKNVLKFNVVSVVFHAVLLFVCFSKKVMIACVYLLLCAFGVFV